jgi:hypothetical protein
MANLKIVVFVAVLVMFARQVASNDFMALEDLQAPSAADSTAVKTNRPVSVEKEAENLKKIDNELTLECARKHIKSCELGSKCRQIICPADTIKEVSKTQHSIH